MPLQQISVSPLDWGKDNSTQNSQHDWKLQETVFATTGSHPPERCASQASSLSNNHDICRICHCEAENDVPLIAPCYCAGSLRYVHQACLQQWIKSSDIRSCELCKFQFIMHSKIKPFSEWETLEMSGVERRKVLCSVTFHVVALTCVVWSLYVLIDRTAEEVHRGQLEWPFWTKLIVVAIGFTGGLVFMYIQCKGYLHLCRRWRAFNRVIFVQNAPEKIALPPSIGQAPLAQEESMLVSETCCGAVVDESACKHKDTATLTKSKFSLSLCESKVNSSSCTKGDVTSSTPLSGVECVGKGSCGGENQNELVDNSNVYQSAVMKQLDDSTGTLNISDAKIGTPYSVSSSRIDLCGRKFSYDEPSSECGEMSHLLESEDKSHHGATSIRPASGFVLLPKFTPPLGSGRQMLPSSGSQSVGSGASLSSSEESFPSPSVRLLQPLQRPWIVGPANSGMNWGATDTPPEQPLSSLGSQSPLLAKPTLKDDASSTN